MAAFLAASGRYSVSPEIVESVSGKLCLPCRVSNLPVPQVALNSAGHRGSIDTEL
jgi:hypothetical protein